MKIKLSEIINNPKMVIHCPKQKQAEILLKELDRRGLKWVGGDSSYLSRNEWKYYEERICYYPFGRSQCDLEHFNADDFTIIEFDDVDFEEETTTSQEHKALTMQLTKKEMEVMHDASDKKYCFVSSDRKFVVTDYENETEAILDFIGGDITFGQLAILINRGAITLNQDFIINLHDWIEDNSKYISMLLLESK